MINLPNETDDTLVLPVSSVASKAVHAAFLEARAEHLSVVVAEGNELIQVGPDDTRTVLKQLPPLQKPARRMLIIR